jgi:hypothetical protein
MEQKLNYLKKYSKNIHIVPLDEIDNIRVDLIPNTWRELFKAKDSKIRINILLDIWRKYVGNDLRSTISYLTEHLEDIEIIANNNCYSILYTIKNSKGKLLYYEGRNPQDKFEHEELEESWDKIPVSIRNFYENVHNGFYYYASESMGLVPLKSVTYLGDEDLDWSIVDELEEPIQINLETSFGFFSNGMGSYIAIDYTNCSNDNATYWSAKKQPRYNVNFWSYVDEWIVIGFE